MDGSVDGLTATGTVRVKVCDINDNRPTLEKEVYSGTIVENTADVEVMRFIVVDADEENTDNWLAVFDIVSGNDDGTFRIETDPKTNEGVLILEKAVDFEETPDIKLGVMVSNVAPFVVGKEEDMGLEAEEEEGLENDMGLEAEEEERLENDMGLEAKEEEGLENDMGLEAN
ncbi:desmoglein-4-like [Thalassophryne amazonica]|uniref:desmoglein-4-like n=1 Tax=Thalassophryne amazonica TaxID=390379 RepID=UPI0014726B59|nr:desmoglein-4-like [Thalassophryne amazonica]